MSKEESDNPQQGGKSLSDSGHEIRYVPVNIPQVNTDTDDDSIDVTEVISMFWDNRQTVYKSVGILFLLGLFVALFSVEEYTTRVDLLSEEQQGFSLGALSGIAQQFGFSSRTRQSSDGISSNLYPSIIQSNVYLEELMRIEVPLPESDEWVPLEQYVREYQRPSLFRSMIRNTVMLPFRIKNWLFNSDLEGEEVSEIDRAIAGQRQLDRITNLTKSEWIALREIRNRITTEIDDETGVVSINVKMQDPIVTATAADQVVELLSDYITEHRTEKARRNFEFIQKRFEEAKQRFEQAQRELAKFNDENRGQLTAMARTEEQLLQSRYELNFNLYNSMAERLEEARIQLQEETPVINVLEPASIPDTKSEPKRMLMIAGFTVLGGLIGLAIIIVKPFWQSIRARIKQEID